MNDRISHENRFKNLLLTVIIPALAVCVSVLFALINTYERYQSTSSELEGLHAIRQIYPVMTELQRIRGLLQFYVSDNSSDIEGMISEYKRSVSFRLDHNIGQIINTEMGIENQILMFNEKTRKLFNIEGNAGNSDELFSSYSNLISDLEYLIMQITNRSTLILDPELESYYLMFITTRQLPEMSETIGRLRGLGSGILAKGIATRDFNDRFEENINRADDILEKLKISVGILINTPNKLEDNLNLQKKILENEIKPLLNSCVSFPCKINSDINRAKGYFQIVSQMHSTIDVMFTSSAEALEKHLIKRQTGLLSNIAIVAVLTMITVFMMFAIANRHFNNMHKVRLELEYASVTDSLTGIPNRRLLEPTFNHEVQRALRDGKGMAFGFLDIDNFKLYNDNYGHSKGDSALKKVAECIGKVMQRGGDFYFRYGGEEFCFMFNAKSQKEVVDVVDNIRLAIEKSGIRHEENIPYKVVTASIGAIYMPTVYKTYFDFWIKNADMMLYEAKDNGRNCCELITITENSVNISIMPSKKPEEHRKVVDLIRKG